MTEEKEEEEYDQEIFDKINETLYWFKCEECGFETDDYVKSYFHRAKTGHIVKTKSIALKNLSIMLK